jgi:hypothetical protein
VKMRAKMMIGGGLLLLGVAAVLLFGGYPLSTRLFAPSVRSRYNKVIDRHNQDLKERIIAPGESMKIKARPGVKSVGGRCALREATFEIQGESSPPWRGHGERADWGERLMGDVKGVGTITVSVDIPHAALTNKSLRGVFRARFVYPKRTASGAIVDKFVNATTTVERPLTVYVFGPDQAKLLRGLRGQLLRTHLLSLYGLFAVSMIMLMVGLSFGPTSHESALIPMFLLSLVTAIGAGGLASDALFGRWESKLESLAGIACFFALAFVFFVLLMGILWQFATRVLRCKFIKLTS